MSRGRARFTEADLRRAKKVAGPDMAVEICPDGRIRLVPACTTTLTPTDEDADLDRELEQHRAARADGMSFTAGFTGVVLDSTHTVGVIG